MTRDELIAALEKAEGPSRELDGHIYMMTLPASRPKPVSWEVIHSTGQIHAWNRPPPHARGTGGVWATPPEYTASIDAALTLVPEGWEWQRYHSPRGMAMQVAHDMGAGHGHHTSPAISLCIAALRARASA